MFFQYKTVFLQYGYKIKHIASQIDLQNNLT